jgi:hypothetical protein
LKRSKQPKRKENEMKMKLNLGGKGDKSSRRVKPWQAIVGVIALVLIPTLGNTFAGSIAVNANNGNNVEFGQGITATAACDPDVTITPSAKYDTGTAQFYLESITVSNIDFNGDTTNSCLGKTIELSVIDSATNITPWGSGNNTVSLKVATNANSNPTTTSPGSGFTMTTSGGNNSDSGTAYFQYTGTPITGSIKGYNVTKIIIQSK